MSHTQFQYRNSQPYYNYPQYGQGMPRMDLKVIMCCEKCEEKVKEEIEELDGKLLQVTHVFKFALKFT
jgi:hypothetical protein